MTNTTPASGKKEEISVAERAKMAFIPSSGDGSGKPPSEVFKHNSNIFIAKIRSRQANLPKATLDAGYTLFTDKTLAELSLPYAPLQEEYEDARVIRLYDAVIQRQGIIPGVGNLIQMLAFQALRTTTGERFFKVPQAVEGEEDPNKRIWKEAAYNWTTLGEWEAMLCPQPAPQAAAGGAAGGGEDQGNPAPAGEGGAGVAGGAANAADQNLANELIRTEVLSGGPIATGTAEQVACIGAVCMVMARLICKEAKSVSSYLNSERFTRLFTQLYSYAPPPEVTLPGLEMLTRLKPQFTSPGAQALMMETVRSYHAADAENDLTKAGVAHGLLGQIVEDASMPLWHFLDLLSQYTKLSHMDLLAELYGSGTRTQIDRFSQALFSYLGSQEEIDWYNGMNLVGQAVKVNHKYWKVCRLINPKWNAHFAKKGNDLLVDLIIGAYNNLNPSRKIKTTEGGFVCYQSAAPSVLKDGVATFVTQIGMRLEEDVDATPVSKKLAESIRTKIATNIVLEFVGGHTEEGPADSTSRPPIFGEEEVPTQAGQAQEPEDEEPVGDDDIM